MKANYFGPIQQVREITDLGVILDDKLTFKHQIDHVVSRAKSILQTIRNKFRRYMGHQKLYMTIVILILNKGNSYYTHSKDINGNIDSSYHIL